MGKKAAAAAAAAPKKRKAPSTAASSSSKRPGGVGEKVEVGSPLHDTLQWLGHDPHEVGVPLKEFCYRLYLTVMNLNLRVASGARAMERDLGPNADKGVLKEKVKTWFQTVAAEFSSVKMVVTMGTFKLLGGVIGEEMKRYNMCEEEEGDGKSHLHLERFETCALIVFQMHGLEFKIWVDHVEVLELSKNAQDAFETIVEEVQKAKIVANEGENLEKVTKMVVDYMIEVCDVEEE